MGYFIMEKKLLSLFYILVFLNGSNIENELGISVGLTSINNKSGSEFKNYGMGVSYELRKYIVMPRFDLDYVKISDFSSNEVDSLFKASINGVYEFENKTTLLPYALAGIGYEHVSGEIKDVFESHPFIQGGVGVSYRFLQGYKIELEGKMLQILGGKNEDNEVIMNFGMSFPLINRKIKSKKIIKPKVIIKRQIIIQRVPIIKEKIKIQKNLNRCPKKIDAPDKDRDGITDRVDQCPATPCGYIVDNYGCPIRVTLKINFAVNSSTIKLYSMAKIRKFAHYLLANKGSRVIIIGYTDSDGSNFDNLELSKRRARAVADKLLEFGVSATRISAMGRGESMPIASNSTEEGKRLNRRIEAILIYPKR